MADAIKAVLEDEMKIRRAAEEFNVPKSTLHDRVAAIRRGREIKIEPKLGRFDCTFNDRQENDLINFLIDMDQRLMPLSKREFLRLVYQYAQDLKIPHRFNKETKTAGEMFYSHFMSRNKNLSLRIAQNTNIHRKFGFTEENANTFYNKLESLYNQFHFPPNRIYNADETGISEVHKNKKVITLKNKKTVGKLASAERGRNVTIMFCASASGDFVPPFFIFGTTPNKKKELTDNMPENYGVVTAKKGWMTAEIFLNWLGHFVKHAQPTRENPVLLILDGHSSHKELSLLPLWRARATG